MTGLRQRIALFILLAFGAAASAWAQAPVCGTYRDAVTGLHLDVHDRWQATEYQLDHAGRAINRLPLLIGEQEGRRYLMPAAWGGTPDRALFALSPDGRRILREHGPGRDFERQRSRPCATPALPPPGPCRLALGTCMAMLADPRITAPALKGACDEGVAFACIRWIEVLQLDAAQSTSTSTSSPPHPGTGRGAAPEVAADPPALAAEVLEQLPAICDRTGGKRLCEAAGDVLWRGLRITEATEAWRRACASREPVDFECDTIAERVAQLGPAPRPVAAAMLPCGLYRGPVWDLDFDERGLATFNQGEAHQAAIDQGDILFPSLLNLRLRPLADGRLIGLNGITLHAVLQRAGDGACPAQR